jgi:hypothetical protein
MSVKMLLPRTRFLIVFVLIGCALELIFAQYTCTITCGNGLKCCHNLKNDACYNPGEQQCIDNRILCANVEQACGDVCYDPRTHICFQNEDATKNTLCGRGEALCNSQCYDPLQFDCVNQQVTARGNDTCTTAPLNTMVQCGTDCFPPQNQSCVACASSNNASLPLICPIGNSGVIQLCCTSASTSGCYDPTEAFCCASPARICTNDNTCTSGECFNKDQCCSTSSPRAIPKTPSRLRTSSALPLVPTFSSLLHLFWSFADQIF